MTTRTLTITLLLLLMGCDDAEPDDGGDDMADSATPAPADLPGDGDGDGVSPSEPCCNLDGVWGPCVSEPEQWCADPQPGWPEQCDDACALLP